MIARAESPSLACTPEGDFEPVQCGSLEEFPTSCQCVQPSDGSPVPGTQVIVGSASDIPDCESRGKFPDEKKHLKTLFCASIQCLLAVPVAGLLASHTESTLWTWLTADGVYAMMAPSLNANLRSNATALSPIPPAVSMKEKQSLMETTSM